MAENIILTVENTTAVDISIDDMRKIISALTAITLTDTATFTEISQSNDLPTLINAGTIILGNGTLDYSTSDAIKVLIPVNNLIFGEGFEKFESLGQSTNTTTTLTDKVDATTAIKSVGTYRIGFSADVTGASGGNTIDIEFSVDGVTISQHDNGPDTYTMEQKNNNDWQSVSSVFYKVLTTTSTIDLNIKHAAGSSTSRISNAVIEIWRVV